jgi:hypothetical protein
MGKTLYFYSLTDAVSDSIRATLDSSGLVYVELRLGKDQKKHNTKKYGVPLIVIDVNGVLHSEYTTAAVAITIWPSVDPNWIFPIPPPAPEEILFNNTLSANWKLEDVADALKFIYRRLV